MQRKVQIQAVVAMMAMSSALAWAQGQPAAPAAPDPQATAPQAAPPAVAPPQAVLDEPKAKGPVRKVDDPYEAYQSGFYDQALQKFVDAQVERPEDPAMMMNIGATHYQMRNYEEAEKAFAQAALTGDNLLKERAFYDLGNVAYRKGELLKAVEYYQSALDLNPDDEDAKFNIEFTRDEIRRRAEEAKKRQEQQQQQQQQGQQQQDQQQQGEQQEQQAQPQDSDKDGLSDEGEKSAKNPTDPQNPDTDGDGLKDGEEDKNQNGQVDAGETDPNKKDSDGDGVSDADEAKQEQAQPAEGQQGDNQKNLTQEQALRTLQALEEGKPGDKNPKRVRGSGRPVKDW